jgi:tRNA threonylcarbamoyladenosine biosynthesis protein TsaB
MIILGIDTSSIAESVAIISGGIVIAEAKISKLSGPHSKLISLIDAVLQNSGSKIKEIDGIAVAIGPGSFTGVRIGVATAKGLALSLNKPLIPISSLKAILMSYSSEGNIATIIDARRNEVYGCMFNSQNGLISQVRNECVATIEDFCKFVTQKTIFIGDDVVQLRDRIKNILGDIAIFYEGEPKRTTAAGAALLGINGIEGCTKTGYNNVIPNYIRRSEAEIKMKGN